MRRTNTSPSRRVSSYRVDEDYQLGREEEAAAYFDRKDAAEKAAQAGGAK